MLTVLVLDHSWSSEALAIICSQTGGVGQAHEDIRMEHLGCTRHCPRLAPVLLQNSLCVVTVYTFKQVGQGQGTF